MLSSKAFFFMAANLGAYERISSIDCAPSTIVAYAQCAASQWPTRSNTASHPVACSSALALVLSAVTTIAAYYAGPVTSHACPPLDRMPRKLLTGWVEHARPVGCPQMTWGRTLKKALKSNDLPTDFGQ